MRVAFNHNDRVHRLQICIAVCTSVHMQVSTCRCRVWDPWELILIFVLASGPKMCTGTLIGHLLKLLWP